MAIRRYFWRMMLAIIPAVLLLCGSRKPMPVTVFGRLCASLNGVASVASVSLTAQCFLAVTLKAGGP